MQSCTIPFIEQARPAQCRTSCARARNSAIRGSCQVVIPNLLPVHCNFLIRLVVMSSQWYCTSVPPPLTPATDTHRDTHAQAHASFPPAPTPATHIHTQAFHQHRLLLHTYIHKLSTSTDSCYTRTSTCKLSTSTDSCYTRTSTCKLSTSTDSCYRRAHHRRPLAEILATP